MPRPRGIRRLRFNPHITYFKPRGIPLRELEVITLTREELEAVRLKNVEGLDQHACAERMNTSQSTFQRILASANQKVGEALIRGKAISIKDTKEIR